MPKDRSKREFLAQFVDEGFVPPDRWTPDALARAEAARLRKNAYLGCVAAETPRRLGEVESIELAGDKYLSKGIANIYWTLWRRLTTAKNAPLPIEELGEDEMGLMPPDTWTLLHARGVVDEDARRAGRTVLWDRWWSDLKPRLIARRVAIATYSMREQNLSWGYRVVAGLSNEIEWVDGKFEDFEARYAFSEHDAA